MNHEVHGVFCLFLFCLFFTIVPNDLMVSRLWEPVFYMLYGLVLLAAVFTEQLIEVVVVMWWDDVIAFTSPLFGHWQESELSEYFVFPHVWTTQPLQLLSNCFLLSTYRCNFLITNHSLYKNCVRAWHWNASKLARTISAWNFTWRVRTWSTQTSEDGRTSSGPHAVTTSALFSVLRPQRHLLLNNINLLYKTKPQRLSFLNSMFILNEFKWKDMRIVCISYSTHTTFYT